MCDDDRVEIVREGDVTVYKPAGRVIHAVNPRRYEFRGLQEVVDKEGTVGGVFYDPIDGEPDSSVDDTRNGD